MSQIIWEPIHEHRDCFKGYVDGFIYVVKSAAPEEKERVQAQHDARVADIAAANGYVKIEPGQVVVDSVHLRWLVDANCRDSCQAYESLQECSQCWVELLRQEASAAIEAAGCEK